MKYPSFIFNIKITLIIGLFGGILFGFYDVASIILKNNIQSLAFLNFSDVVLYPVIIYGLFGLFGMVLLGVIIFFLAKIGEHKLDEKKLTALQIGMFTLVVTSVIIVDISNIGTNAAQLHMWDILFFTIFPSASVGILAYFILTKYSLKKISQWVAGFIILLIILSGVTFAIIKNRNTVDNHVFSTNQNDGSNLNTPTKPNILWIIMDTARADHFSSYGYARNTTPEIDKIADEGVLYENAISPAPWTLPAHTSMLTGMFPSKHGVDGSWTWLGDEFITIAEILKKNGYKTAAFSNNGNFSTDQNLHQGFDTFAMVPKIIPNSSGIGEDLFISRTIKKFQVIFNIRSNFFGLAYIYQLLNNNSSEKSDSGAENTNKLVLSYLNNSTQVNSPFFIVINYMEVHDPYGDAPNSDIYLDELNINTTKARAEQEVALEKIYRFITKETIFEEETINVMNALYDGDLKYLDNKIGELVEVMRLSNILDNTMIIITSDHGENLGERNMIQHLFDLHRTLTHVPLIIKYPKTYLRGARVSRIVQTTDIFPTILDVAKISSFNRQDLQGYSLLNANRPQTAKSEAQFKEGIFDFRDVVYDFPSANQKELGGTWKSIQDSNYEYITSPNKNYLYNMKIDSGELNNVIEHNQYLTKKYQLLLVDWLSDFEHYWNTMYTVK